MQTLYILLTCSFITCFAGYFLGLNILNNTKQTYNWLMQKYGDFAFKELQEISASIDKITRYVWILKNLLIIVLSASVWVFFIEKIVLKK
jgi:hypothetical protein